MYQIPKELDLSPVVGEFTTQVRVGQFDIQFTFGKVSFAVQSKVLLKRDRKEIGRWEEGTWPNPTFYEIMNTKVNSFEIIGSSKIVLKFENGIEMFLENDSNHYESMQISIEGDQCLYVI